MLEARIIMKSIIGCDDSFDISLSKLCRSNDNSMECGNGNKDDQQSVAGFSVPAGVVFVINFGVVSEKIAVNITYNYNWCLISVTCW